MNTVQRIVISATLCMTTISFIAGCEEAATSQAGPADAKMYRLIAVENRQLKGTIDQRDKTIAERDKTIATLQTEVKKCEDEKQAWKTTTEEQIKQQQAEILAATMDEASKVSRENEELKAEIKKLKSRK